jgi:repressor LexA
MMVVDLSERQRAMLEFMRDFMQEHDYPPSIRDIQLGCRISSTSVVDYNLKALERGGFIRRDREVSRAIVIEGMGRRPRTLSIPIVGAIAAGQPIPVPSADNIDYTDTIDVSEEMTGGKLGLYALRVKGTSMIDALINDGDIVVLEPARDAQDGEMVAAWLKREEEATLKKFYREGTRVRLQPANSTMEPIYTDADNVEIHGKVVLALRRT